MKLISFINFKKDYKLQNQFNFMDNKKRFLLVVFIALILNLIWEFSHYQLYFDYNSITGAKHLVIASIGDFLWISLIFGVISLINKKMNWIKNPKRNDYLLAILFGMIIAIFIEVVNVYFLGRWAYKEIMPTIFGIGLSPLVQLAITSILSLKIGKKIFS